MANPECPCKQTLTDGEKGVLNFGLTKDMLKDPNAAAVGLAKQLGGRNGGRLAGLITTAQSDPLSPLFSAAPSLQRMKNSLDSQAGIVDAFATESARFTDPRYLTSIISSMSLFGELNCALGIEGLDIGVGLNVVNNNGQFSIDYAVNSMCNRQAFPTYREQLHRLRWNATHDTDHWLCHFSSYKKTASLGDVFLAILYC